MNISPHTIDNVLSDEQIEKIYSLLNNATDAQLYISEVWGQKSWTLEIPQDIIDGVSDIIKNIYGDSWYLEIPRVARYDNTINCKPYLDPHIDNFLDHRITLDIQLKSNIDWPIIIDGQSFSLKNNSAIIFSGTNNIHWRPEKDFKDGDFVDLLFCHFRNSEKKYEISNEENRQRLINLFNNRIKYGYPADPVEDENFEKSLKLFESQQSNNADRMV